MVQVRSNQPLDLDVHHCGEVVVALVDQRLDLRTPANHRPRSDVHRMLGSEEQARELGAAVDLGSHASFTVPSGSGSGIGMGYGSLAAVFRIRERGGYGCRTPAFR